MEYLTSFLSAAALISVASALAPAKEGVRRAVLSAFSVILLFLLIPRGGELSLHDLFSFTEESTVTEAAPVLGEAWKAGVENGIRDDLCQKYDLSADEVSVACTLKNEENTVTVTHLSLTLSGKSALADATGMLLYIEKNYGTYAEIHLKG